MSTPLSPEAEALWKLLAKIESATSEKSIRDLAYERVKVGMFERDVLVKVEAPSEPLAPQVWNGTGWVSSTIAPPIERVPVPPGRVEGSLIMAPTRQPEDLPGSPQHGMSPGFIPSPRAPSLPQPGVFSPQQAAAMAAFRAAFPPNVQAIMTAPAQEEEVRPQPAPAAIEAARAAPIAPVYVAPPEPPLPEDPIAAQAEKVRRLLAQEMAREQLNNPAGV